MISEQWCQGRRDVCGLWLNVQRRQKSHWEWLPQAMWQGVESISTQSEILLRKVFYGGEGDDKQESIKAALGHTPCLISSNPKAAHLQL